MLLGNHDPGEMRLNFLDPSLFNRSSEGYHFSYSLVFIQIRYITLLPPEVVVVVVVVVYLTTNQRHMGYLSSGNGHLAERYSTP